MYVVRFIRKDKKPIEEYYYSDLAGAQYHLSLFADDNSNLYERIELENFDTGEIIDVQYH